MDKIEIALLAISILAIAFISVIAIANLKADKLCLEHGWRDYKITWDFTVYCIREENEYEVVKPLKVIISNGG